MNKEERKKMFFLQRLYKSIIDFEVFSKYIEEPLKYAIKYLAMIVLIYSICVSGSYILKINREVSKGTEYLSNNSIEINIENNILNYGNNEEFIYKNENSIIPIIIVNTNDDTSIEEYKNNVKIYNYGFIILRDRVLISTPGLDDFETIEYTELSIGNMEKEEILASLKNVYVYLFLFIVTFIVEYIQYFIYTLFFAIVLAVVGQIVSLILRLRMSFKSTYIIGIYGLTLPTALNIIYILINTTTGFVIQHFNWMYTTISYIYVCVAILMIKTDFINLKREMMRIKMEEENTNSEIMREKNPDKQDDDKNEKEEQEEKNDENNDLKEQTDS